MTCFIRAACGALALLAGLGAAAPAEAQDARKPDVRQQDAGRKTTPERAPRQADLDALAPAPTAGRAPLGPVFGTEPARTYSFPGRGGDLDDGAYWQVNGHASGHKRDLSATRFDAALGRWTGRHPAGSGRTGDQRSLIWDAPVHAPASGIVLTCWRNAPDGEDPGEAGCGDDDPRTACTTPGAGNHVRLWIPEESRMMMLGHFRQGSVPRNVCPHDDTHVANWDDKSGAFGFNPDILVPFPFRYVEEGDLIGRVGNSGRSGGPHLHMQLRQCDSPLDIDECTFIPLRLDSAQVAFKPSGRDAEADEFTALNGALTVSSPRQLVLPHAEIDDFAPVPANRVALESQAEGFAQVTVDATNPEDPVSAFQWERVEPPLDVLAGQATLGWTIDATCASGIVSIDLEAPGETATQSYPDAPTHVSGTFETPSFAAEELEAICVDWAGEVSSSALCSQAPEVCASQELFELVGGSSPGAAASTVDVTVVCADGTTMEAQGAPELTLRCGAAPFGFPQ